MDGLEEKLGSLLSDPTAMEKLRQLAGALSGGMPDLGPGFGSGPEPEGTGGLFGGGEGKLNPKKTIDKFIDLCYNYKNKILQGER